MKWFQQLINQCIHKREQPLSAENLDAVLRQTIDLDKIRFTDAISSIHTLSLGASIETAAAIYDLAIWAVGRSVAADGCSALMLGRHVVENHENSFYYFPFIEEAEMGTRIIDISKCNAYTGCWNYERISSSLDSVLRYGYSQPEDSNGLYYPEIRFAVMMNGRHHTTWAAYLQDCRVKLNVISLKPYYDLVSTDGAFYYFQDTYGVPQQVRIKDYRMAVLFQLAKERDRINVPNTADAYVQRTRPISSPQDNP